MKNIIYLLFVMVSANLFAQASIVNDELFLKYEAEYLKYSNSRNSLELQQLDQAEGSFYRNISDEKAMRNFKKSKDKLKWLGKNISKTNFANITEAQANYTALTVMKKKQQDDAAVFIQLRDELIKKYDPALIWKTQKDRMQK